MRCNQVSIFVERFGEFVPEDYPQNVQRISVYVDDFISIYAALSKAYAMTVNELAEYERIGVRANVSTNEFEKADYRKMHGVLPKQKRKYEEDLDLEYYDTHYELAKDYVWLYEHSDEVITAIKQCGDGKSMEITLQDLFDLSEKQARKIAQIRLDMLTKAGYETNKKVIENFEIQLENNEEFKAEHRRRKIIWTESRLSELQACEIIADNYNDIFQLRQAYKREADFRKALQDLYGIAWHECGMYEELRIKDFSKKEREKRQQEIRNLEERLEFYKES